MDLLEFWGRGDKMKNGTALLLKNNKKNKIKTVEDLLSRWICNWIEDVTESPYVHYIEVMNGYQYETKHPGGFKKSVYRGHAETTAVGTPKIDLSKNEVLNKIAWWEDKIKRKLPYNYLKLFTALILHRTKPFWEWLGWVPFQDIHKFGDFCFAAGDESWKYLGYDIAPNQIEQISTARHFTDHGFYTWENLING